LSRTDEHYEGLIEWLQSEQFRYRDDSRHYHALVGMLQDVVGEILRSRHVRNPEYHRLSLPWFQGLTGAVPPDAPLWVFSLNHDLHVEFMGIELGLPLAAGYPEERAAGFYGPDGRRVWFDRISRAELARYELGYPSTRGINLVKLHGGLEVFAYKDRTELLRVRPDEHTVQAWTQALTRVEDLGERITGEICVRDNNGIEQFLRRTVVTGGFKFDERAGYNAPSELVEFFARKLEDFDELVVIGYSWSDHHINGPIEMWLNGAAHRRVVNVDPRGLNQRADHLRSRVDERCLSTAEFLASFGVPTIDPATVQLRDLRLQILRLGNPKARFQEAFARVMRARVSDIGTWLADQDLTGSSDAAALFAWLSAERRLDLHNLSQVLEDVIRELRAVAE
jgi:hypothetical protein